MSPIEQSTKKPYYTKVTTSQFTTIISRRYAPNRFSRPPKVITNKYVLSGIVVFTKYLFAVPLTNGYAETVARELVKVFFQHSYFPQTILSDLGTNFTSELMSELASLLEVKLKHASLKHPQTIGAVERSHGPLKRILKLNTEEQWKDWHKYVPLATFIHNTSYHSATNCCPST